MQATSTDKTDARILRALQRDGRISNAKLATQVHLSPTAVLERVRRLTRDGYILGYQARLNPRKLGAGLLVFVEVLLDRTVAEVMSTFRTAVHERPEILECHLVAGGFDYLLKTRVADMHAYRELLASVIWALPGVRETRTFTAMEETCRHAGPAAVDEIDARLLRLLQADGRITNADLAHAVGLSPAAVHERVRRLIRDDYILGYEAVLDPAKLGGSMLVFAEVRTVGVGPGTGAAFRTAVQLRDEILECHEVAGGFDYLIKTRVPDMRIYRDLVASVVWSLPGVRDVRTYAVIEEVKSTSRIPI